MGKNTGKEDKFYLDLGKIIKKARINLHLTQQQLADLLGLNRTSITNIELGKQKILAHMLVDFAFQLKVPIDNLLPKQLLKSEETKIDNLIKKDDSPKNREFLESVLDKIKGG